MAEKKKSWFGRLFGGKKDVEQKPVESTEQQSAPEAPQEIDQAIPATIIETSEQTEAQSSVETKNVATSIVEDIAEEIHESFSRTKEHAEHHEAIKPQHSFIEEIANDAAKNIKAAEDQSKDDSIQETVESSSESEVTTQESEEPVASKIEATEKIVTETDTSQDHSIAPTETPETVALSENSEDDSHKVEPAIQQEVTQEKPKKKSGFFAKLSSKLSKTRSNLTDGIADLFLGKKEINEEILEELETRLLMADVGITVTDQMLSNIRDSVSRKSLSNVDDLFAALKTQMKDILEPVSEPLVIDTNHKPYVILMIGVNGVGKTTTIGKLAKKFQAEGKSVMLAAGDTFRAAAVEQLEIWGERNNIAVISQKEGADPASVIFDAMESAKSKKIDILIADTAGRLHTDSGLMQELGKINRVIKRHDETAPHEVMLVVDASTGQNALNQARQFNSTVPLSGITFTKLDGTAKGGIIFAIAEELKIPIRFIGVGESIDDLRPFNAEEFVDALIETDKPAS
ncbi:signal recognition particle-docking protein FtsY [Ignatzschineria sp. LJL83]